MWAKEMGAQAFRAIGQFKQGSRSSSPVSLIGGQEELAQESALTGRKPDSWRTSSVTLPAVGWRLGDLLHCLSQWTS